jgi:hypothetical protein
MGEIKVVLAPLAATLLVVCRQGSGFRVESSFDACFKSTPTPLLTDHHSSCPFCLSPTNVSTDDSRMPAAAVGVSASSKERSNGRSAACSVCHKTVREPVTLFSRFQ